MNRWPLTWHEYERRRRRQRRKDLLLRAAFCGCVGGWLAVGFWLWLEGWLRR